MSLQVNSEWKAEEAGEEEHQTVDSLIADPANFQIVKSTTMMEEMSSKRESNSSKKMRDSGSKMSLLNYQEEDLKIIEGPILSGQSQEDS